MNQYQQPEQDQRSRGHDPVDDRSSAIVQAFQEFAHTEESGGILLLACTVAALVWANSVWSAGYAAVWQTELTVGMGSWALSKPLLLWISDGLMALFFFVVGLEIKREIMVGELRSWRRASLPVFAALGGMVAPALFYAVTNAGQPGASGWGVPMATDIAFALGVMALLGPRVPIALKVFLTAVAIADDLGAVVVIALFYTEKVSVFSLGLGGAVLLISAGANAIGVRRPLVYALLGAALWLALLKSGVHATLAGVLAAMTIPARARLNTGQFLARSYAALKSYEASGEHGDCVMTNEDRQDALHDLEIAVSQAHVPLQHLEHTLLPWVTFLIMPLFALANAGVEFGEGAARSLADPVSLGIILGLVLGKPLGILLVSWVICRANLGALPTGVTWRHMAGASCLAGIGFTMSLFIGGLAFGPTPLLASAKMGILFGSLIAGTCGWVILRTASPVVEES